MLFGAATTIALFAVTGCDSGTQEPDAPAAQTSEYGAAPAPDPSAGEAAAPAKNLGDGTIASERFPREMPTGASASIPTNFPTNVPVYPGSQPGMGMGSEVGESQRAGVQLLSNDTPADVFGFYESELVASGWEITDSRNEGGLASLNASNGDVKMALIIAPSADGGSDIFVISED
jgi:hypothetical protein